MTPLRLWLLALVTLLLGFSFSARAEEVRPDDRVIFNLTAEDWITTKTARVTVNVEAAVSGNTAGTMRAAMNKAVEDLVKADWRLVSFNRGQDQTGMERWSTEFEARVPENALSGLNENAKKLSKPGMQLAVNDIDFSPTLEETQGAYALLRTKLYKMANDQLAALNTALPGRTYRIALIDFSGEGDSGGGFVPPMPRLTRAPVHGKAVAMETMSAMQTPEASMERSEKAVLTAHVVLAVVPPAASGASLPTR